ncbi:sensor histidine kinase [Halovenus rubra]|uniref:histidine kinase n=2 Tax=Halovenus rubra TaxID=869890 RepID=A0ABD5X9A1_9EURY|nr:HAMP domain-containing sensor histidine kinase [Halovenus rubra]
MVGFLYVPFIIFILNFGLSVVGVEPVAVLQAFSTIILLYCLGLALVGTALLLSATYNNVQTPVRDASLLAVFPLVVFVVINIVAVPATQTTSAIIYLSGLGIGTASFGYVVWNGDLFEQTPAVERIGKKAIVQETDDMVFVVDDCDSVVTLNETAIETLDVSRESARGEPLTATLDYSTGEVRQLTTVSMETINGPRQYDPQVSTVTDGHGTELGMVLSLRDVTERELREQRLSVLNRVLRHNLRNKIEVIKSRAEVLGDEIAEDAIGGDFGDSYTETIVDTADEIAGLGKEARTIDKFVSESTHEQRVDISVAVRTTLASVGADDTDVAVSVDVPDSATVTTNQTALTGALDSALDNALTYADSRVSITVADKPQRYHITVADDGPGIPDSELAAIEGGTETALQHGTGLGLWQLKWAVRSIDGTLSFETTDGTTVEITVPRQ